MIAGILSSLLEIFIGTILPKIIRKEADRARVEKRLQDALGRYQSGVGSAARIREVEAREDDELDKKWQEKWGTPTPTTPPAPQPQPDALTIAAPMSVAKNEEFTVTLSKPVVGAILYADQYQLVILGAAATQTVRLNTAGVRRISVRSVTGIELAHCFVRVQD
jgi:hypothetical protein